MDAEQHFGMADRMPVVVPSQYTREGNLKYTGEPKPIAADTRFEYGTAGFRVNADQMGFIAYRIGYLASLRARTSGKAIGVMITASHNPEHDNGVKLIDSKGEMLAAEWETYATGLVNATDEEFPTAVRALETQLNDPPLGSPSSLVACARDTRASGPWLTKAAHEGAKLFRTAFEDCGLLTTPQLHYIVYIKNRPAWGPGGEIGYYEHHALTFNDLYEMLPTRSNSKYVNKLHLDCANGVGAPKMRKLAEKLPKGALSIDFLNEVGQLNHDCGADYVKISRKAPACFEDVPLNERCAVFDGDADRLVYFYKKDKDSIELLDGDKIAVLFAKFYKDLLSDVNMLDKVTFAIVQTAYANGRSTKYMKDNLFFFSGKASESVIATIKERILSRVLHRDAEYFDRLETSNSTIVNDMNQQPGALLAGLDGRAVLFGWCTTCICVCNGTTLILCWQMGTISIALTIAVVSLLFGLFIVLTGLTAEQTRRCRSPQLALEIFSQTRVIQTIAVEEYFVRKYSHSQEEVSPLKQKSIIVQSIIFAISHGSLYLFGLTAYGIGAHFVYNGWLTGKAQYMVGLQMEFVMWTLSFMAPTFPDLMRANAAARILYKYFDLPEPLDVGETKKELSGSLEVRNLTFAYPSRPQQPVAKQLTISANAGESIALVGPSGCGKSTLIALLERFYEQQSGTIRFDRFDHRQFSTRHLRTQIALVGQEPVLFQGSIAENVRLGCGDCSKEDVRDACRISNAADFIEHLPGGYDTDVGSKGRSLSGGQKQRIAIARALVRKPKILLLDEATSALDGESERIVQEAIAKVSEGRTSISIAHRLATIKESTRIYFIEDGSVAESGNHEELIQMNGKYASYVNAQCLESD